LPNGNYIASHDLFGPKANTGKSGTTYIYTSKDKGITWTQTSIIVGQYWSGLFYHNENLYILGTDKGHGNIVIRKSSDNGISWTTPVNSETGLIFNGQYHTAPTPVVVHNGRLWRAFENANGIVSNLPNRYGALMITASEDADLLNANNWKKTNCLVYDATYMDGNFRGWLEGNALITKENKLVDMLRVHIWPGIQERAAIMKVACSEDKMTFQSNAGFINFPGGAKKFTVRFDYNSQRYWSLVNYIPSGYENEYPANVRNYLVLASSENLLDWQMHKIILSHIDSKKHGFQYVDWQIEGEDMIFLSRTAYDDNSGGADSFHNANFLTFHRISNFRSLTGSIVAD